MEARRLTTTRARAAIFAPIAAEGRAAMVEQRLGEAIRSGVLDDGERLPSEPELAAMLGVATVTAREALTGLRSQGLVVTTRGRGGGSFVCRPPVTTDAHDTRRLASMSRVELRDRGVMYRLIATGIAELAAERADPYDVEFLHSLLPAEDDDDVGRWRRADAELSLSIAALTHSARVTREFVTLEADFGSLLRIPLADRDCRVQVAHHHRAIIAAIADRDGEAARRRMRVHVTEALERVAEIHATVR
ncbi:FadR/GntR family transcriptional regulator [Williamsia sp. CHRR-6]|uniref:FadR/GntR family transcriptional regulator n=1 Tax=Williamsia sp. CHRR-6 TaxID=2835871 RepID=UPI001BD9A5A2|nr:FCD domain-containing protein [Williamsia sp. CHRR-6]MBT0568344.1 FadR family transcriptional regulator [Williamsia sp. CHRR-6]